jgi:hypothetical protein
LDPTNTEEKEKINENPEVLVHMQAELIDSRDEERKDNHTSVNQCSSLEDRASQFFCHFLRNDVNVSLIFKRSLKYEEIANKGK